MTVNHTRRLTRHFGIPRVPFDLRTHADHMFESKSQRDLLDGLELWLDLRGIAAVTGPAGVGKSITLRRFTRALDEKRIRVVAFGYLPTTATGFLRSLNRRLGLPMRAHRADLFDAAHEHLITHEDAHGTHPLVILDDAEGLNVEVCDILRRLTCHDLDARNHFSLLLVGTDSLIDILHHAHLEPLRTRITYARALRPFGVDDARSYVRYHLQRADASPDLFNDAAITALFKASRGHPRVINQLAIQALIDAAVAGHQSINLPLVRALLETHPLHLSARAQ